MNIVISTKSDKPIYEQIYDQISSQILKGTLYGGYTLPPVRTLAKELGVGIVTVKKAYELLETSGLIYSHVGRGSFVWPYSKRKLESKKTNLVLEKLREDIPYYKSLNVTLEELIELLKQEYPTE